MQLSPKSSSIADLTRPQHTIVSREWALFQLPSALIEPLDIDLLCLWLCFERPQGGCKHTRATLAPRVESLESSVPPARSTGITLHSRELLLSDLLARPSTQEIRIRDSQVGCCSCSIICIHRAAPTLDFNRRPALLERSNRPPNSITCTILWPDFRPAQIV